MQSAIIALISGIVTGKILMALFERVGLWIYPPVKLPEINTFQERMAGEDVMVPGGAFVFALVGWGLGSLLGAWLASWIAQRAYREFSLVTGGVLLLGGLWELLVGRYPFWFWILGLCVILPAARAGGFLARRMREG